MSLPKRPKSHIVGSRALMELENILPEHWIVRPTHDDYGIDCEIEIVDEDGSVTGALLKCQIKGTEQKRNSVTVKTSTIRYWLGIPVPVILVLIHYPEKLGKWLYVRQHLLEKNELYSILDTEKKTYSFSFKNAKNLIESYEELYDLAVDHSFSIFNWLEEEEQKLRADFIGYHILIHVFDGDPDKMLNHIQKKGSEEQLTDIPFVLWVKAQLSEDPDLINRIRTMVEESSSPGGIVHERAIELGLIKK